MRRCRFQRLVLLSTREKAARIVELDETTTTIAGPNDTGKSALIKSLFTTLGASPHSVTGDWSEARVASCLFFSIETQRYSVLRMADDWYAVFDGRGRLVQRVESVTRGLAPLFADMFDFRLKLQPQHGSVDAQATPAFLFLPFYVDQDRGWAESWSSFRRLGQFRRWKRDVAEFHSGVRPNDYFSLKTDVGVARQKLQALQARREVVASLRDDLQRTAERVDFRLSLEDFRSEVEELLSYGRALQDQEDTFRERLVSLHSRRLAIDAQLDILKVAGRELEGDYQLAQRLPESVECPTCGADYANSIAERFDIARDAEECRDVEDRLRKELVELTRSVAALNAEYIARHREAGRVHSVLEKRQGDLTLREVIEGEGRRVARDRIQEQIDTLNREIGELDAELESLQARLTALQNQDRKTRIVQFYRSHFEQFCTQLSVRWSPSWGAQLTPQIAASGSELPRALLAYYYSILHTINEFSSSTFCPIVIDSPKTQDQDPENWRRMMRFIVAQHRNEWQLILGTVDTGNERLSGKRLDLDEKHHVLIPADYEEASTILRPLIEQARGGSPS